MNFKLKLIILEQQEDQYYDFSILKIRHHFYQKDFVLYLLSLQKLLQ